MESLRSWPGRLRTVLAGLAAGLVLTACGGGGDAGGFGSTSGGGLGLGVGSGGTGMFASGVSVSGPIRGFGSVIVNGIRFDDSSARITVNGTLASSRESLDFGMMVEIEGDRDADGLSGVARSIAVRSYVEGPISALDTQGGLLTVLGVAVAANEETVFRGGAGQLADLAIGDQVEVHGIPDASGRVSATRIEKKPSANEVRLTGRIEASDAGSITVNGIAIKTSPAILSGLPGGAATGTLVDVRGVRSEDGTVVASSVQAISLTPPLQEGRAMEVEGVVTAFASASEFEVNGVKVQVAANAKREGGAVALGVRIEVEGRVAGGILQASKVEVKRDARGAGGAGTTGDTGTTGGTGGTGDVGSTDGERAGFELHGHILAIDRVAQTFTLSERTAVIVQWDAATRFDDRGLSRGAASLAPGMKVEVKGSLRGGVLLAAHIEPDD